MEVPEDVLRLLQNKAEGGEDLESVLPRIIAVAMDDLAPLLLSRALQSALNYTSTGTEALQGILYVLKEHPELAESVGVSRNFIRAAVLAGYDFQISMYRGLSPLPIGPDAQPGSAQMNEKRSQTIRKLISDREKVARETVGL